MPTPPPSPLSLRAYARRRGVSAEAVSRAIAKGRLQASVVRVNGAPKIADPEMADREWAANTDLSRAPDYVKLLGAGLGDDAPEDEGDEDAALGASSLATAAAREKHWRAELAELNYKQRAGVVVNAAEMESAIAEDYSLVRTRALDTWRAPTGERFTIVLVPTVVKEVDTHKADERNPTRRSKAQRLVRQFGEYRRRGRLTEGVTLVANISQVAAIAVEPRMSDSLAWLDPSDPDDRLLASAIEVMRQNVQASVVVVTRDVNLQNKLEFARLPFLHPRDIAPAEGSTDD